MGPRGPIPDPNHQPPPVPAQPANPAPAQRVHQPALPVPVAVPIPNMTTRNRGARTKVTANAAASPSQRDTQRATTAANRAAADTADAEWLAGQATPRPKTSAFRGFALRAAAAWAATSGQQLPAPTPTTVTLDVDTESFIAANRNMDDAITASRAGNWEDAFADPEFGGIASAATEVLNLTPDGKPLRAIN